MPESPMSPSSRLPSDPLSALGPSLFLSILSHLPYQDLLAIPQISPAWNDLCNSHSVGIWRSACWRSGVESEEMTRSIAIERERNNGGTEADPDDSDDSSADYPWPPLPKQVDWKDICKRHIMEDRNWRFGRCRDKWITGGGNAVWRFKLDEEQGTCMMTSRLGEWRSVYRPFHVRVGGVQVTSQKADTGGIGGLHVVDSTTSRALFSMRSVRPYAHLEFCKGYAVFDVGQGTLRSLLSQIQLQFCSGRLLRDVADLTIQVYRTSDAISRSSHPAIYTRAKVLPREALSSISHTHHTWTPQQTLPPAGSASASASASISAENQASSSSAAGIDLPRGHLAYYRTITPPSTCRAFRARLDREGVEGEERAMLATAGERGFYIWDLEDEESKAVEAVVIPEDEEDIGIQYVEFDDDYIFLCGHSQLHIFSRKTKKRILAYPPIPNTIERMCAIAYQIDPEDSLVIPHDLSSSSSSSSSSSLSSSSIASAPPSPPSALSSTSSLASPILPAEMEGPGPRALIARAYVLGCRSDESGCALNMMKGCVAAPLDEEGEEMERVRVLPEWPPMDYDFSACHYTSSDLICATRLGQLLITRNYASVLSISDPAERERRWGVNTLIIGLGQPIQLLAVDRTHVTVSTPEAAIFFDTRTLPDLPLPPPSSGHWLAPSATAGALLNQSTTTRNAQSVFNITEAGASQIRLHVILSASRFGIHESSCAQITKDGVFYTYFAAGEVQSGGTEGRVIVRGRVMPEVPDRAMEQFGICVRGWDFGWYDP